MWAQLDLLGIRHRQTIQLASELGTLFATPWLYAAIALGHGPITLAWMRVTYTVYYCKRATY